MERYANPPLDITNQEKSERKEIRSKSEVKSSRKCEPQYFEKVRVFDNSRVFRFMQLEVSWV